MAPDNRRPYRGDCISALSLCLTGRPRAPRARPYDACVRDLCRNGRCVSHVIGTLRLITSQSRLEAIKTKNVRLRHLLRLIIDGSFMLALTIMVLVCAVIAYAIV